MIRNPRLVALASLGCATQLAFGIDNVFELVDGANATNGKNIASFGYKPDLDGAGPDVETFYVAAYGVSPFDTSNSVFRKVTGVGGTVVSTALVSEAQQRYFYTNGIPDWKIAGTVAPSGFMLNPVQIGSIAPYSNAWLIDGVTVQNAASQAQPASSDRVSRYSLQPVQSVPVFDGDGNQTGVDNSDALVQLSNVLNLSDFQSAASTTSTAMNWIRQGAWSSDGQSIYQVDASANFGGVWKINPLGGAPVRIVTASLAVSNGEIAVLPQGGGVDRILLRGSQAPNNGGINYVDYSGATVTDNADVRAFVEAADLIKFLDRPSGTPNISSITTDAAGNVYFLDTTADVIVMRDTSGRLIKVTTRDEVSDVKGETAHGGWLRLQTRQVAAPGGTATQVMFMDSNYDAVMGATVRNPGDFNADGIVDSVDKSLFLSNLSQRGVDVGVSTYDLNGNKTVDWKDVKILQGFLGFSDGDANLDGIVDFSDLNIARDNYYPTFGKTDSTWAEGDFASLDPTADIYAANASDANRVDLVDLYVLAANWGLSPLTLQDIDDAGYTGVFRQDVITAFNVPEPAGLALVAALASVVGRRRRS